MQITNKPALLQASDITKPNSTSLSLKNITKDQFEKNPADYGLTQIFKFQQVVFMSHELTFQGRHRDHCSSYWYH